MVLKERGKGDVGWRRQVRRKGVRGKIRGVYGCALTDNMQTLTNWYRQLFLLVHTTGSVGHVLAMQSQPRCLPQNGVCQQWVSKQATKK